jgi:hypothetical protein
LLGQGAWYALLQLGTDNLVYSQLNYWEN